MTEAPFLIRMEDGKERVVRYTQDLPVGEAFVIVETKYDPQPDTKWEEIAMRLLDALPSDMDWKCPSERDKAKVLRRYAEWKENKS